MLRFWQESPERDYYASLLRFAQELFTSEPKPRTYLENSCYPAMWIARGGCTLREGTIYPKAICSAITPRVINQPGSRPGPVCTVLGSARLR
jgi:hypothetical protein